MQGWLNSQQICCSLYFKHQTSEKDVNVGLLKQFMHRMFCKPLLGVHIKWFKSFIFCSVLHRSAGNVQSSSEEKDAQIKSINKEVEGGEQNRKSATSLILFEEVKFRWNLLMWAIHPFFYCCLNNLTLFPSSLGLLGGFKCEDYNLFLKWI